MASGALRFDGVVKTFGGTRALKGVSFDVRARRSRRAARRKRRRQIDPHQDARRHHPARCRAGHDRRRALSPSHQAAVPSASRSPSSIRTSASIEWMTVAENIGLAQGFPRTPAARPDRLARRRGSARSKALALVGCDLDPTTRVPSLSRTEKSLVAIARALVVELRLPGARRADRQPAGGRGGAAV